jgi:hypothetical protein
MVLIHVYNGRWDDAQYSVNLLERLIPAVYIQKNQLYIEQFRYNSRCRYV